MSYTADYQSIDLSVPGKVRDALIRVAVAHGWAVIDNVALKEQGKELVDIRFHGTDQTEHSEFEVVLQNPNTDYHAYDVGMVTTAVRNEETGKEEEKVVMTYDPYGGQIENEWGKDLNGLRKEVLLAAVQEMSPDHIRDMSMEELVQNFVSDPETGDPLHMDALHDIDQAVNLNTLDAVSEDTISSF